LDAVVMLDVFGMGSAMVASAMVESAATKLTAVSESATVKSVEVKLAMLESAVVELIAVKTMESTDVGEREGDACQKNLWLSTSVAKAIS